MGQEAIANNNEVQVNEFVHSCCQLAGWPFILPSVRRSLIDQSLTMHVHSLATPTLTTSSWTLPSNRRWTNVHLREIAASYDRNCGSPAPAVPRISSNCLHCMHSHLQSSRVCRFFSLLFELLCPLIFDLYVPCCNQHYLTAFTYIAIAYKLHGIYL